MDKIIILILVVFLSGCVTLENSSSLPESITEEEGFSLLDLNDVSIGMAYSEVIAILGEKVRVGYQKNTAQDTDYKPIELKNIKREQMVVVAGKKKRVVFIHSYVKRADGIVSDDELTPLVFENDILKGKSWNYYLTLVKK